ncbi:DUF456 family protein [Tsukamurella sp. 8F]|uniref:DUF456 domain-containing protein n=1 Tax=unclassified Tsukamurella TaxID=2633480 RepID=UPI0023B996F8|nr:MULTISPECIES: DUF456 domain-containing protein [unclassified Tsukamurella]MDF0531583.1 DUF456 family protein [Tsukamurella sp. 8J]MDF0587570.1 DUF456 family protein [Tsukamurella sp. 8F]
MDAWGEVVVGLVILVGLVGVVVPVLPGSILIAAAVLVWAAIVGGTAWWVLAAAALAIVVAGAAKYLVAGRSMTETGVHRAALLVGGLLGIVGFFVVPVVGLVLGFVLGVWATESARLGDARAGWRAAVAATKAVGIAMLIELAGALVAAGTWLGAVSAGVGA